MYPIRICGIRVPPKGEVEYAVYDDAVQGVNAVTCFHTAKELAEYIVRVLREKDFATAQLCTHSPQHLANLIAFHALPAIHEFRGVSNPQTTRLSPGEQKIFLRMLGTALKTQRGDKT